MPMIYVDMDGVLAVWAQVSVEETHKPGYFRRRECQVNVRDAVLLLAMQRRPVAILTAFYPEGSAKEEKEEWLAAVGLGQVPRVFVPYGTRKVDALPALTEGDVLLDDYSHNLREWKSSGGVAVKFRNGINGRNGTWCGRSVTKDMTAEEIAQALICASGC